MFPDIRNMLYSKKLGNKDFSIYYTYKSETEVYYQYNDEEFSHIAEIKVSESGEFFFETYEGIRYYLKEFK